MKLNRTAQTASKASLEASLMTALRIYGPARHQCRRDYDAINFAEYHPVVAAKIIGLAFLSALTAWEDFLSEVFLGYMCGYQAPNGYAPHLRTGTSQNRTHAIQVLTAEENPKEAERRTRWSSIKWVQSVASIHFRTGDPFTSMDSQVSLHIEWATTIRNRVAHNSDKARAQFKDVANRLLKRPSGTAIGRGFLPGQLLIAISLDTFPAPELDHDYQTWGDNFEAYISLFLEEARRIVPSA
jgi:hypothetical protein